MSAFIHDQPPQTGAPPERRFAELSVVSLAHAVDIEGRALPLRWL
jgi:hypothetical protein